MNQSNQSIKTRIVPAARPSQWAPQARRPASSPSAAGFRPAGAALAVAAVFMGAGQALAQPSGAQVIQGQASISQQGSNLVVTTQNAAGTNRSAINWQSFSIPAGSSTRFDQPNAASLSINRVLGNNPSAIYGTLSSNGRLVLVNPSGIAVGAGAVVDTAGFTASTLRMSDADALAGRLVFGGDGLGGGALSVEGKIVARSGDVVLIAPNLQVGSQALVQSPNGATLLAAGQKVELTGRGLEGIRLELQAPGDQAVNLGTLQGDAVGIFAGQLKHSGLIQATAVSAEGGKVVLKGVDTADISGRITARKGDQGGQVHATAGKVMLRSGAVIDVSGAQGGGEALIGGGWQGKDSRIANAIETLVEAGATLKADATTSGNGGTVVAWSDGATRVYGALSARGGEVSGNGGNIETSGHYLDMQGQVDTRAPNGSMGNLLLDPTNMYIALDQTSATAAGMIGTSVTSTGPTFTPTGPVQDSLVTTGSIESFLGGANVLVQTTNVSGSGAGFIKVVDPLSWSSGSQLTLNADADIMVNAAITSAGSGPLSLRAKGNITQAAAISVSGLLAISDFNAVTLNHSGNAVGTLSGYAGVGQNFSFTNGSALDVGSVAGSFGVGAGANNVSITTMSGDLNISDTTYGVRAGTGTAALTASTGSVTEDAGAKITASAVTVTANNSIDLAAGTNDVQSFSATQTGSTGGNIAFVNSTSAAQWTLNNVTQNALSPASVSISSSGSQNIQVQGNVFSGSSSSLSLFTAGAIIQGSGLLRSNTITLQAGGLPTGPVGTSGMPLQTASNGTSTTFNIGATGGPSGIHINHAGNAVLNSITPNGSAPIQFKASGNLTVPASLNSGSSMIFLGAGSLLSASGGLTANGIMLEADRMDLSGAAGSINAGSGVLWVKPTSANVMTDLGSSTDAAINTLELSTNELNTFAGTGALRIGSLMSGSMNVSAAIAPTYGGTITLESGGNITQAAAGTISTTKLAIKALGDVTLDTAANPVSQIAASLGNMSNQNRAFRLKSSGALNVASGIDGTSGIFTQLDGTGYNFAAQNGFISLVAAGALTQDAGALLGGKAVYAQGSRVELTQANPTGVISGTATGTSATDAFKYSSFNGINVNDVAGGGGVHADNSTAAVAIELTGSDVSQKTSSYITTPKGLKLVTSGPVFLTEANTVGALTATGASSIDFRNSGALTVGVAGTGVSATNNVDIRSADALSVSADVISGMGVVLQANGIGKDLTINAMVDSGSGFGSLLAMDDIWLSGATLTGSGTTALSATAAQVPAGPTTNLNTNLTGTMLTVAGTMDVNSNVSVDSLGVAGGGALTGSGDLTVNQFLYWTGGSMGGTGQTILALGGQGALTGAVALSRPLENNGIITFSAAGDVGVSTGASLSNTASGIIDIQNNGGFSGTGGGSFSNAGAFMKSVGTGTSSVDGLSFTNTGYLDVYTGTLQFGSAVFSSNSGGIMLAAGATLANTNTTLANTSSGFIAGSGTLDLGTGTLNNDGFMKPGGFGTIGTLTVLAAGGINHGPTANLYIDLTSAASHDQLVTNGNVVFDPAATVILNDVAPTYLPGDSFDVIVSTGGTITGTPIITAGFTSTVTAAPDTFWVTATPAPTAAPSPSPSPSPAPTSPPTPEPTTAPPPPAPVSGPVVEQIVVLLEGDHALAAEVIAEMATSPLTTFTTLLLKEEEKQAEGREKGLDNLVDDNQCKR